MGCCGDNQIVPKESPPDADFMTEEEFAALPQATKDFLERLDTWSSVQVHRCKVKSLWDYAGIFFKILKQLVKAGSKYFWAVPIVGQVLAVANQFWPLIRPLLNIPIWIGKLLSGGALVKMPTYIINGVSASGVPDTKSMLIGQEPSCGLLIGNTPLQDSRKSQVEFRPLLAGAAKKGEDEEAAANTVFTFKASHPFQCFHPFLGLCKKVPKCELSLPGEALSMETRQPNSKHEVQRQKVWWAVSCKGEDRLRVTHPMCPRIFSALPKAQLVRDVKDENRQATNLRVFDFYQEGTFACPGAGDGRADKKILIPPKNPGEEGPPKFDEQAVEALKKLKRSASAETVSFEGMSRMEKLCVVLSLLHSEFVIEEAPINEEI